MNIYKALLKYGYSVFKLEILEYCDPKNVIKREQYYLNLLEPKYNILQIAGSSFGYKHSEETKGKISRTKLGCKLSEEARIKMAAAKVGG